MDDQIAERVARLNLEEKAGLCTGAGPWQTLSAERSDIKPISVSDGPPDDRNLKRH
jgi:hypothetical protein